MGRINVLSFAVANLIAAGEVVDRPASVIKELLENAIDSGADTVTVEIQNGGVTYMRVSDNGCGIEKDDLPVAIRRHATSKIKDAEDLEGIITLGFRGEALAAIASVSDMRIISKTKEAQVGAVLEASSGNILGVYDRAASNGTSVIVENLFANVPARRKFLKKDVTESMAVSAVVEKIALSKPNISFKLIIDGNIKMETVGDGSVKNTVYSVFGREFAAKLIPAKTEIDGITVEGFVGRSDNVRANRNYQNFFINGRYVKSKTACAAIEQAYTSYIPPEKFPCCILFLSISPAAVDVNVHPSKLEVKFSNEKPVFEAVYYAVRNALEQNSSRPEIRITQTGSRRNEWMPKEVSKANVPIEDGKRQSLATRQIKTELYTMPADKEKSSVEKVEVQSVAQTASVQNKTAEKPFVRLTAEEYIKELIRTDTVAKPAETSAKRKSEEKPRDIPVTEKAEDAAENAVCREASLPEATLPADTEKAEEALDPSRTVAETPRSIDYRILGEAFNSYVIVEKGEEMLVIDKHAAHERIIFEGLKAGSKDRACSSQLLMIPIEVMMTSEEIQTLCQYEGEIRGTGFEFTAGRYTVSITALPTGIPTEAVSDMLVTMADRIKSGTGSAGLTRDIIFEKALYQASCKAAIKAGREYSPEHIKWIVDKLMELPDITVCPHGRPVAMVLSKKNLDRQFERT